MGFWDEFNAPSVEDWGEKIKKDLKINSLERIFWNSEIGPINPILSTNNFNTVKTSNDIAINASFNLANKNVNKQILYALKCGVNSLTFSGVPKKESLKGIMHEIIQNHIIISNSMVDNELPEWESWIKSHKEPLSGSLRYDPIQTLVNSSQWSDSEDKDLSNWTGFYNQKNEGKLKCIYIDGLIYANSCANPIEELSFICSHLNEYLNRVSLKETKHKIIIRLGTGSSYFTEIAKIRALRILVDSITNHHNMEADLVVEVLTKTSIDSPTHKELNLLRATTSYMSAYIGGANIISINPSTIFLQDESKSIRLLTNIPILLKEEAHINKVNDPSSGAHVIEQLTSLIINTSWDIFKTIETKGGWINYLKTNLAQESCKENSKKLIQQLLKKEKIIIGFNKYNLKENEIKSYELNSSNSFQPLNLNNLI